MVASTRAQRGATGRETWTRSDRLSLAATLGVTALCAGVAAASYAAGRLFFLALSLGALGGLIHELAQSYGTVFFFKKYEDGLYLGTLSSMVLGGVAGALVVQGQLMLPPGADPVAPTAVAYAAFLAGLALKGVTEAATGSEVEEAVDEAATKGRGLVRDVAGTASGKALPRRPQV